MNRTSSFAILGLLSTGTLITGCCRLGPSPSPSDSADPAAPSSAAPATAAASSSATAASSSATAASPAPAAPISTDVPCGAKGPPPWTITDPALGAWGEDMRTAPSFGYEQERRAPKMPDGDDYFARAPARTPDQMDNALLICHVEVYTRNGDDPLFYHYKLGSPNPSRPRCLTDWDTFAPPDVLLKFRIAGGQPISLFAPEDHWGFFISVPRLHLAKGDLLEVKLWDRDSTGDSAGPTEKDTDYIGYAKAPLTGTWPVRLSGPYFTMRCKAMSQADAESAARKWIGPLDDTLKRLENTQPDPKKWDFGEAELTLLDTGEFSFGKGNFRYVAGFLGWDHPAVQERLAKQRRILYTDWPRKKREAAATLAKQSPPPGKAIALGGKSGTLKITGAVCQGASCTVTAELTGTKIQPSSADWKVQLASIDNEGAYHTALLTPVGETPPPGQAPTYQMDLGSTALVLWIQSPAGVSTVKVRDPE